MSLPGIVLLWRNAGKQVQGREVPRRCKELWGICVSVCVFSLSLRSRRHWWGWV